MIQLLAARPSTIFIGDVVLFESVLLGGIGVLVSLWDQHHSFCPASMVLTPMVGYLLKAMGLAHLRYFGRGEDFT